MDNVDLLNDPGFIILEWIAILGILALFALVSWMYLDNRNSRGHLYEKIDALRNDFRDELKTVQRDLQDYINKCADDREEDARWKGGIDKSLEFLKGNGGK